MDGLTYYGLHTCSLVGTKLMKRPEDQLDLVAADFLSSQVPKPISLK